MNFLNKRNRILKDIFHKTFSSKKNFFSIMSNKRMFSENISNESEKKDKEIKEMTKEELKEFNKQKLKEKNLPYTDSEFKELIKLKGNQSIPLFNMSLNVLRSLKRNKRIATFFNIPMSVILFTFGQNFFHNMVLYKKYSTLIFCVEYYFFISGIVILRSLRNFCLSAEYIHNSNKVIFTKLDFMCKPYVVEEKVEDLTRMNISSFNFLTTLMSNKTKENYSMNGLGQIEDPKLFNYLFKPNENQYKAKLLKQKEKNKIDDENNPLK